MDYYIDTEFLEGKQDKRILGFKYGETKPTIDLISIGIVTEDNDSFSKRQGLSDKTIKGREYYAVSKDFNLYEAWNRYDEKINNDYNPSKEESHYNPMYIKEYWIRENVLKPIYNELYDKENLYARQAFYRANVYISETNYNFTYKDLKRLINKYGKTNKQIAEEVRDFCYKGCDWSYPNKEGEIKFYGHYSDYDHVVLCQLFGKMIDLPKGFPMYTIDLKQELDSKVSEMEFKRARNINDIELVKGHTNLNAFVNLIVHEAIKNGTYPKQINKHNALSDAIFNKELHNFLKTL